MPQVAPGITTFNQLAGSFFQIPLLQRNYVWDSGPLDNFITTIGSLSEDEDRFLGSLIHLDIGNGTFEVIDGQQRTTTVTLFVKAFCDVYNVWKELTPDAALKLAVSDYKVSIDAQKMSLGAHIENLYSKFCERRGVGNSDFLTLKGKEGERYDWIMEHTRKPSDLHHEGKYEFVGKKHGSGTPHIYAAYQKIFRHFARNLFDNQKPVVFFDETSNNWTSCADLPEMKKFASSAADFLHKALTQAYFVKLTTEHRKDVFDIFDAVNGTGVKLTKYDLLRNQISAKVNSLSMTEAEKKELDKKLADITDENTHYVAKVRRHVHEFVAVAKTGKATKNDVDEFWKGFRNGMTNYTTAKAAIGDLESWFSTVYDLTEVPEYMINSHSPFARKLKFFSLTTSVFHVPLLLRLVMEGKPYTELSPVLRVCERLFIQERIMNGEMPQVVKNKIKEVLLGDPTKIKIDYSKTAQEISTSLTSYYFPNLVDPTDALCKTNNFNNNQSKWLLWNVNDSFVEAENAILAAKGHHQIDPPAFDVDWTLEHILPKSAKASGWGTDYEKGKEKHEENLNKLGNHTLYRSSQNIKMGNKSWAHKKTHLPAPSNVDPEMILNQKIFDGITKWEEDEINIRSKLLVKQIKSIWFN